MKVIVAGGSGFLGQHLSAELLRRQHSVCILSRSVRPAQGRLSYVQWDGKTVGAWKRELDGADAVINLTGRNILTRWTDAVKRDILSSRLDPVAALIEAMAQAQQKPRVFVSASAVGYYGDTGADIVTENHAPGSGFAATVCKQWEEAALRATGIGVRTALPRIGLVLDTSGGALKPMKLAFSLFTGGPIGSGRQHFPWVHIRDLVRAVLFPVENSVLSGAYNVAAPEHITMSEFARVLGRVMQRPSWLPVPSFAVRLALGEAAEMLLEGQNVAPALLQQHGFIFEFTRAEEALYNLLRRVR